MKIWTWKWELAVKLGTKFQDTKWIIWRFEWFFEQIGFSWWVWKSTLEIWRIKNIRKFKKLIKLWKLLWCFSRTWITSPLSVLKVQKLWGHWEKSRRSQMSSKDLWNNQWLRDLWFSEQLQRFGCRVAHQRFRRKYLKTCFPLWNQESTQSHL